MKTGLVAAQIGCGAFAIGEHGPNACKNANISKIKWACDVSAESAAKYAEQFDVEKTTTSFEDITCDPEVDIILIATSHEAHLPIIESAAANGKHIFCEKPMAMDVKEAYKIIRTIRKHKVKLCVDYMRRMSPSLMAMKREWLKHKKNPQRQPWRYIETAHEPLIEEKCTDFLVRIQDESSTYRMVHLDPFRGGGLIIGEAVHWLDLACWLFDDDRPVKIQAWGSARMRYGIYMEFASGNAVTITFTPNGTFDYPKEFYEIACNGALFRNEFYVENQYYGRPGRTKEIFPLVRDALPEVGTEGGLSGYLEKYHKIVNGRSNAKDAYGAVMGDWGYAGMFDGFIDAVINDTPAPCDELAGYRATLLGALAKKSIERDQAVSIEADKWDIHVEL